MVNQGLAQEATRIKPRGMRARSPLRLLPSVFGYSSKAEWPNEAKSGCVIVSEHWKTPPSHHYSLVDFDLSAKDPSEEYLWSKVGRRLRTSLQAAKSAKRSSVARFHVFCDLQMQFMLTAPVNRSLEWNPDRVSIYFVFIVELRDSMYYAIIFDIQENIIKMQALHPKLYE